jgi:uncharacterized membrane protein
MESENVETKNELELKPLTKGKKIWGIVQLSVGIFMLIIGILTLVVLHTSPFGGIVFFVLAIVAIYRGLKTLRIFQFSYTNNGEH